MDLDFMWIGLGIAALGYFIGDGLKNFRNPNAKGLFDDSLESEQHELIREKDLTWFIGISEEDVSSLLQEYKDIPHIKINGKIYFNKAKLREWLSR